MKTTILTTLLVILSLGLFAQVGINSDNSAPNTSAMLDVKSTTQGMLAPRMTLNQRDSIANASTGLLIYQTDEEAGFYSYSGIAWQKVSPSTYENVMGTNDQVLAHNSTTWVAQTPSTGSTGSGQSIENRQPSLGIRYLICVDGDYPTAGSTPSSPFMGQITLFAGTSDPGGWISCEGQLLSISAYSSLYTILSTTYGGDGITTFGLPDLSGRIPIGQGTGFGLSSVSTGEKLGTENNSLSESQLAGHNHTVILTE